MIENKGFQSSVQLTLFDGQYLEITGNLGKLGAS